MSRRKRYIALLSLVFAGFLAGILLRPACAEEPSEVKLVLLTHSSVKLKDIKSGDLKRIYEGKKKTLSGLGKVTPVDLPKDNASRLAFCMIVLEKDVEAVDRMYLKNALSGKGQPPKTFKTEKEVVEYVKENKQALAYVDATVDTTGVNRVSVDGENVLSLKKEK